MLVRVCVCGKASIWDGLFAGGGGAGGYRCETTSGTMVSGLVGGKRFSLSHCQVSWDRDAEQEEQREIKKENEEKSLKIR